MKSNSPLMTVQDYGRIRVKLNDILVERHLTRGYVARMTITRFEVIDKWCSGSLEKIDSDVLARLCCVLSYSVEDLLEYAE